MSISEYEQGWEDGYSQGYEDGCEDMQASQNDDLDHHDAEDLRTAE
jgi:hypothetical protein